MKLDLVYKTPALKSVNVGIFSGHMIKHASSQKTIQSGEVVASIVASMCDKKASDLLELSELDMNRIVLSAWRQTYMADVFVNKNVVCECNYRNSVEHKINNLYYEQNPIYTTEHVIVAPDMQTFSPREYKIKLLPRRISRDAMLMKYADHDGGGDEDSLKEILLRHQIKSVDDNETFNVYDLPFPVLNKIGLLIEQDKDVEKITTTERECEREGCNKKVTSVVGLENPDFLALKVC